jgi:ribosomal protein L35AE/L33A
MAKSELTGTVLSFRQSKFKEDSYQTIVRIAGQTDVSALVGARVVWARTDGFQIKGRIVAHHGSSGAVRVRWNRGFPPQALGSPVRIHTRTQIRGGAKETPKAVADASAPLRKRPRRTTSK